VKKTDIFAAFIIGEVSAWLIIPILKNLDLPVLNSLTWWSLPIILPIFTIICLWTAYYVGKKFGVIWQVAKFGLVGALNTLIDLGVLNILILISGTSIGITYSIFKGFSFVVAVINSYFWNKFWTFKKIGSGETGKEFVKFLVVSIIGFGINVGIASLIVNVIGSPFTYSGISEQIWANIGAVIATVFAMTWNFIGYKFIVFK